MTCAYGELISIEGATSKANICIHVVLVIVGVTVTLSFFVKSIEIFRLYRALLEISIEIFEKHKMKIKYKKCQNTIHALKNDLSFQGYLKNTCIVKNTFLYKTHLKMRKTIFL